MGKSFSKKNKRKTKIKLDFYNFNKIYEEEFVDKKGNTFRFEINANFKDPFFKQTVKYGDSANDNNK